MSSQLLWKHNVLRGSRSWQNLLFVKYRKPHQTLVMYPEDILDILVPYSDTVSLYSSPNCKNIWALQGTHCDHQWAAVTWIMCSAGVGTPACNKREKIVCLILTMSHKHLGGRSAVTDLKKHSSWCLPVLLFLSWWDPCSPRATLAPIPSLISPENWKHSLCYFSNLPSFPRKNTEIVKLFWVNWKAFYNL